MELHENIFKIFADDWALVTAGTIDHYNTMTIGWGGLGTLWGRPVATVYVKPVRYTHRFLEENDWFTVSFYPEQYKKALALLGTKSGRDGDKVAAAGLTPEAVDNAVTFRQARLTLLCKKIYRQDLDAAAMPADVTADYYTDEAPHTMYVGQVMRIIGQ